MADENWLHFDPVQIILTLGSAITIWTQLRASVKWHSQWILKHEEACTDHKKDLAKVLTAIQSNQAQLTTLTEGQDNRLERLENWRDKL